MLVLVCRNKLNYSLNTTRKYPNEDELTIVFYSGTLSQGQILFKNTQQVYFMIIKIAIMA